MSTAERTGRKTPDSQTIMYIDYESFSAEILAKDWEKMWQDIVDELYEKLNGEVGATGRPTRL